jgi:hypothetical protein
MRLNSGNSSLLLLAILLYAISFSLLLFASTHHEIPGWGGPVDVGAAFALVIVSAWIYSRISGRVDAKSVEISYQIATVLPAATFLMMWWFAERLIWNILLPGLAWRTWLFLYTLPRAITLVRAQR